jgi:prepilin-type N-terminal cleavage/methylation domain-containing protein
MPLVSNQQSKIERAFTLIELLVVIAIVGILVGLAVVSMSGATEGAKIAKSKVFSDSVRNSLLANRASEWRFDEGIGTSTADLIGANAGILTGGPSWKSGADCVSGGCLNFDGNNDYIDAGSDVSLILASGGTIETWVNIRQLASSWGNVVLMKGDGSSWANLHYVLLEDTGGDKIVFSVSDGTTYTGSGGPKTPTLTTNTWYYITATWNSTQKCIYLNGALSQCVNSTVMPKDTMDSCHVNIGRSYPGSYYFNGFIDDTRVYNSALTASAVRDRYLSGVERLLAKGRITNEDYQQRLADLNSTYAIKE